MKGNRTEGSILKNEGDYPLRVCCHQRPFMVAPYPLWWGVDQGTVEAGGLGIQGQHQLLLLEQGLRVCLRVSFPLGQWDDASTAQGVSPGGTI